MQIGFGAGGQDRGRGPGLGPGPGKHKYPISEHTIRHSRKMLQKVKLLKPTSVISFFVERILCFQFKFECSFPELKLRFRNRCFFFGIETLLAM